MVTTASARNFDFLSQLGANEVIDYRVERFEDSARDLDVVFDTVGGKTLKRSWSLLNPRGRMVTIAADTPSSEHFLARGKFNRWSFFSLGPSSNIQFAQ